MPASAPQPVRTQQVAAARSAVVALVSRVRAQVRQPGSTGQSGGPSQRNVS